MMQKVRKKILLYWLSYNFIVSITVLKKIIISKNIYVHYQLPYSKLLGGLFVHAKCMTPVKNS